MKKRRLLIVGAFDFKGMDPGGQLVKTRELYYLLNKSTLFSKVSCLDTCNWKLMFVFKFIRLFFSIIFSTHIVILPAHNGLRFFSRLLPLLKGKRKIYYNVIGGWLPVMVSENFELKKNLMKFNKIFVETSSMKRELEQMGLTNAKVVPNFKNIKINEGNNYAFVGDPIKVCTFSRVIFEKGIEDAIYSIEKINEKYGRKIYVLDIYGPVDETYNERFKKLIKEKDYVNYCGVIDTKKSVDVLNKYFALLFPTKFYTEGIPGTIIDSYCSGTPIITSLWKNYHDVFENNVTGLGYEFNDFNGLVEKLDYAYQNTNEIINMRKNCIEKAKLFSPSHALELLIEEF